MTTTCLAEEERALTLAWERHDAEHLDAYLVEGVEDPRINVPSILTRALLADRLRPGAATALIEAELRFGAVLTWLLRRLEAGDRPEALLDRLDTPDDPAVPPGIRETRAWLQREESALDDYISAALATARAEAPARLDPRVLDAFLARWRRFPFGAGARRVSVLEFACGSANDYRFLAEAGLAAWLDYAGVDLCPKNIANARRRFPGVPFIEASILSSGLESRSRDCVFVHDLFEHLSAPAIEMGLGEMARIARDELWIHLFNGHAGASHEIVRTGRYHWNRISTEAIQGSLSRLGFASEALFVGPWMTAKFGLPEYHNGGAVMVLARRLAAG